MSISSFGMRRVLGGLALVCGAALAVCGQGGAATHAVFVPRTLAAPPAAGRVRTPLSVRRNLVVGSPTIYGFQGPPDGWNPRAGLVDVKGVLYGTTSQGGTSAYNGTVFAVTPSGSEKILHSFTGPPDGQLPYGALINVGGTLYGTTYAGGTVGHGTVFSIKPSGKETVLYSFQGAPDGAFPYGRLLYYNGALYGTAGGGTGNGGTVFEMPLTGGQDTILYNFSGNGPDGGNPQAGLIYYKGALYGTTFSGGADDDGTVFKVTLSGTETVLHSFTGYPNDGNDPSCDLVRIGDNFFGTTWIGGANGYGTVFRVTASGHETVLFSFNGNAPGGLYSPQAGLIDVAGTLWGTAPHAGDYQSGGVFSITPSGNETEYYLFSGQGAPAESVAPLLYVNGTLYGTSFGGGSDYGAVFAVPL